MSGDRGRVYNGHSGFSVCCYHESFESFESPKKSCFFRHDASSIVVKTGSPQDKNDHQHSQPDGQRAYKELNHRQHESDVGKL